MRAAFESPKFHYPINISPHCESGRASMGSCWLLLPIRYHWGRASMRTRAAPSPMQINGQTNEEKKSARTTPAGWMVELNRDPEQSVRHHRPGRVLVLALGPSPINWIDHTWWDMGSRDVHRSERFKLRTRKDLGTAVIGWFVFRWWWWTCRWFCYYVVPVTGSPFYALPKIRLRVLWPQTFVLVASSNLLHLLGKYIRLLFLLDTLFCHNILFFLVALWQLWAMD